MFFSASKLWFSSGGNIALVLANYLTKSEKHVTPKKVFVIDSPVDLAELYDNSIKSMKRKINDEAKIESKYLSNLLMKQLGDPDVNLTQYEKASAYTLRMQNIQNIEYLNKTNLRFYTESDPKWWKLHFMLEENELNSYSIKNLVDYLKSQNFSNVKYIESKLEGRRTDGSRHPHSWSIVDQDELITWILDDK